MDYLVESLNWCATAARGERLEFIKKILDVLTDDERKQVKNFASKSTRRNYKRRLNLSSQDETVIVGDTALVPVSSASVPVEPNNWFNEWNPDEIVGVDVEMVTPCKKRLGMKKFHQEAATVAICDFHGKPVKKYNVLHAAGSYKVNFETKKINGFDSNSLAQGIPIDEVIKDVIKQLQGKLLIFCSAYGDLSSMNLSPSQFDIFDLQQYWKEAKTNSDGVDIEQKIGLKHIYHYYFGTKIQTGIHDPMIDAQATMKIFREVYMHLDEPERFPLFPPFINFPRVD